MSERRRTIRISLSPNDAMDAAIWIREIAEQIPDEDLDLVLATPAAATAESTTRAQTDPQAAISTLVLAKVRETLGNAQQRSAVAAGPAPSQTIDIRAALDRLSTADVYVQAKAEWLRQQPPTAE